MIQSVFNLFLIDLSDLFHNLRLMTGGGADLHHAVVEVGEQSAFAQRFLEGKVLALHLFTDEIDLVDGFLVSQRGRRHLQGILHRETALEHQAEDAGHAGRGQLLRQLVHRREKVLQEGDGENISFVVSQKATTIAKTEGFKTVDGALKYTFTGETANGTLANGTKAGTYSFTNHGTFAGAQLDVSSKKEGYFYFANSMFLSSDNLKAGINKLNLAPFRAFYTSEAQTETGAKMSGFDIIFGEGIGDSPTGINDVTSRIDTGIRAGKGTITIMSAIDNNVKIYTAGGMNYYNIDMQAGETKTVEVPAGIYIVNGVKVIVK